MKRAEFATCPSCGRRVKIEANDVNGVWLARHRTSRRVRGTCRGYLMPVRRDAELAWEQAWKDLDADEVGIIASLKAIREGGVA